MSVTRSGRVYVRIVYDEDIKLKKVDLKFEKVRVNGKRGQRTMFHKTTALGEKVVEWNLLLTKGI